MAHVCFHGRKWVHTRLCQQDRTQRLTRRNRGCFGWGRYLYPLTVLRGPETLRGQVSERQTLPLLRLDPVCSRRTQKAFGTAMRLCASLFRRRRGPAGLRDLFRFCRNCGLYALCSELSACARWGALSLPSARFACSRNAGRPLVKTTCLPFSEVDGHCSPRDAYFLANIQVSLSAISVANTFALWYDKSQIRIFRR